MWLLMYILNSEFCWCGLALSFAMLWAECYSVQVFKSANVVQMYKHVN